MTTRFVASTDNAIADLEPSEQQRHRMFNGKGVEH